MTIRTLLAVCLISMLPAVASAQMCNGMAATIIGTAAGETIVGTAGADVIVGLGGNDIISGADGADSICGGDGDDDIYGGAGDDVLIGDDGDDVLSGGAGNDDCDGVTGIDSADDQCETVANSDVDILPITLFADDGTQLDGALYVPTSALGTSAVAMVQTHGSGGTFESGVPRIAGLWGVPYGFTVLAFNRRNHGPVQDPTILFEDATLDLVIGVDFLEALGYELIFVGGHSQGTTNAGVYPSLTGDERLVGAGMYASIADNTETARTVFFTGGVYEQHVATAEQMIADGRGDELVDWLFNFPGNPTVARTSFNFLSFWGPDTLAVPEREVQFSHVPVLLMSAFGDNVTPLEWSVRVRDAGVAAGVDTTHVVIPFTGSGGAAHGFAGVEREVMQETFDWLDARVPETVQRLANVPAREPSGNYVPVANAGKSLEILTGGGDVVTLDGVNSLDPDGGAVSYSWLQTGGASVNLNGADSPSPSFTVPRVPFTTLEFELTVTDDQGASAGDTTQVDVICPECISSVGSATWLWLLLLFPAMHRFRQRRKKTIVQLA